MVKNDANASKEHGCDSETNTIDWLTFFFFVIFHSINVEIVTQSTNRNGLRERKLDQFKANNRFADGICALKNRII